MMILPSLVDQDPSIFFLPNFSDGSQVTTTVTTLSS